MPPLYHDHLPIQIVRIGERKQFLTPQEEHSHGTFYISREALSQVREKGPAWKYYNIGLIEEVLEDPCSVLAGLRRNDFSDGQCYAGRPSRRFNNSGGIEVMPENRLFLVFVKRLFGMVVFDWEFRACSQGNRNLPANHGEDFVVQLWQK